MAEPRRSGSTPDRVPAQLAYGCAAALLEPIILLLAFRVGLGGFIPEFWRGRPISYLAYLAPGMLAYTAFMTAFFQVLFAALHPHALPENLEGQLVTQLRLEHVVWGEVWGPPWERSTPLIVTLVLARVLRDRLVATALGQRLPGSSPTVSLPWLSPRWGCSQRSCPASTT